MDIPGYRIIRELGRGGMATVYLAEQLKFGREVALKVMSAALVEDPSFQSRFLREARTLAQISHPNIVTVFDVDVHENYHFFSMEYHTGGDLKQRIRSGLTPADALRITKEIAGALDRAHERGIIHRDIKPGNILFARDGRAILTDFGIARNYDNETQLTQLGTVTGTPKYMSPEQARGQPLQGPSDLYSLGIVFYEMLAGVPPFLADDSIALGIKHLSEPVPPLPAHLSRYQPLVERMLAKQAAQRPATGSVLVDELTRFERGLPPIVESEATVFVQGADEATMMMQATEATQVLAPAPATGTQAAAAAQPQQTAPSNPAGKPLWWWGAGAAAVLAVAVALVLLLPSADDQPPAATATAGIAAMPVAATPAIAAVDPDADINRWLARGDEALAADRLMTPANDNAVLWYQQVLQERPGEARAGAGLRRVAERYVALAHQRLEQRDTAAATQYAERARQVDAQASGLVALEAELAQAKAASTQRQQKLADLGTQLRVTGLLGGARGAEADGDNNEAARLYREALKLDPGNEEAKAGLARVKR